MKDWMKLYMGHTHENHTPVMFLSLYNNIFAWAEVGFPHFNLSHVFLKPREETPHGRENTKPRESPFLFFQASARANDVDTFWLSKAP
jgi:hypothetical protein